MSVKEGGRLDLGPFFMSVKERGVGLGDTPGLLSACTFGTFVASRAAFLLCSSPPPGIIVLLIWKNTKWYHHHSIALFAGKSVLLRSDCVVVVSTVNNGVWTSRRVHPLVKVGGYISQPDTAICFWLRRPSEGRQARCFIFHQMKVKVLTRVRKMVSLLKSRELGHKRGFFCHQNVSMQSHPTQCCTLFSLRLEGQCFQLEPYLQLFCRSWQQRTWCLRPTPFRARC